MGSRWVEFLCGLRRRGCFIVLVVDRDHLCSQSFVGVLRLLECGVVVVGLSGFHVKGGVSCDGGVASQR